MKVHPRRLNTEQTRSMMVNARTCSGVLDADIANGLEGRSLQDMQAKISSKCEVLAMKSDHNFICLERGRESGMIPYHPAFQVGDRPDGIPHRLHVLEPSEGRLAQAAILKYDSTISRERSAPVLGRSD
jgi:hypothetical protein